jgi:DNA (cytosine-5)-methyltransferase 1
MSRKKHSVNSFFAGIGGFDVAFEKQGFSTKLFCEINPFCNQILNRHWPNVKKVGDINKITEKDIPNSEVWCGGFPCQDISVARGASERLGLKGKRSGLFYRYAELIEGKMPEVVIIENVAGLFTSNKGRDFGVILQTLSALGYSVAWRLLNSRYFGVPQSRTRVYVCCWKNNPIKALNVMFDKQGAAKPKNERIDFITEESKPNEYPKVPKVAYCLAASSGRHTGTDWSRTYVVCENGVRRLSPVESERLQGFPDNWTSPSDDSNSDENINTLRYTAIGNAVTVPVVEWIATRVKKQLNNKDFEDNIQKVLSIYPDLSKSTWSNLSLSEIDFSDTTKEFKWKRGGLVWADKYMECNISPTPSKIKESSLLNLIEKNQSNPIYFLSPNAAEGILRRVDGQNRSLFVPLRVALEKLSSQNPMNI